jgi:hypothetical protein
MPIDGRWEKCSVNSGVDAPTRTGKVERPDSSGAVWSRWWRISSKGLKRYEGLDGVPAYRVEFRTHIDLSMGGTEITRTKDGNKIFEPISPVEPLGGSRLHSVIVQDTGRGAS